MKQILFLSRDAVRHHPLSFPTRRSSDLTYLGFANVTTDSLGDASFSQTLPVDRKSTRLNSSHLGISYAVFCLKKKRRDLVRALARPGAEGGVRRASPGRLLHADGARHHD